MQIRAGQIAVVKNNPFQIFAFQPAYMFAGRQKHHLFRLIRHRNVLRQSSQAKRATGRIFCHFWQRRKPPRHFNVLNVTAGKTGTVKRIQRIQIQVAVNYKTAVFVLIRALSIRANLSSTSAKLRFPDIRPGDDSLFPPPNTAALQNDRDYIRRNRSATPFFRNPDTQAAH